MWCPIGDGGARSGRGASEHHHPSLRRRSANRRSSKAVVRSRGMLKQKIRKSRKNLLSLLESASFYGEDSEGGKKDGKGGKRGKEGREEEERRKVGREVSPGLADEGYSTAGEKTSPSNSPGGSELGETLRGEERRRLDQSREVRRGEERPVRGQAMPMGQQQPTWGVPVLLAYGRRSSPQEDFLWSLQVPQKVFQGEKGASKLQNTRPLPESRAVRR